MRRNQTLSFFLLFIALVSVSSTLTAQNTPFGKDDSSYVVGKYNIWGYAFMDYYYKGHSDTAGTFNGSYHGRGGSNQYTGVPQSHSAFQSRRIYLGFDYNLSKHFSTEFLLADEDNFTDPNTTVTPVVPSGDLTADGKSTFYLKLANIRWKNLWKGTDFVFGQQATPSFPLLTEVVWGYRSIERTVSDIRRTPSFDFGAGLNGIFDPKTRNFGYDLLVGNGTQAKPVPFSNAGSGNSKWFYGDIWAKLFDKHLILDLYADYYRLNWVPTWHNSRQMVKGYIAYTTPKITIGVEGFMNTLKNDAFLTTKATPAVTDTANSVAQALSYYIRGRIIGDKLGFFIRMDNYNPNKNITSSNVANYSKIVGHTSNYIEPTADPLVNGGSASAPTVHETFFTAGLDFTPIKSVHIMPNIWYDHYHTMGNGTADNHDMVYRMTFYYIYGK